MVLWLEGSRVFDITLGSIQTVGTPLPGLGVLVLSGCDPSLSDLLAAGFALVTVVEGTMPSFYALP